jgi:hypothetical protein
MATLSSCKEDEGNDPEPVVAAIVCSPTIVTETSDGDVITTTYEYNDENQVIKSIYTEDEITLETVYTYVDGKLTTATSDGEVSTFLYNAGTYPVRINTTEDGEEIAFTTITSSGNNITKIENSEYDDNGDAVLIDVTNLTYVNNVMSTVKLEEYDAENETFTTELEIVDFVFDGKSNPYNLDIAYAFENDFNPLVFTSGNLSSANLVAEVGGEEVKLPYNGTYTYNDNSYPTTAELSAFGFTTNFTYEYNCK